jgi:stage IV sporulation protein FB
MRLYLGHLGPIPLFVHWSALLLVLLCWMWAPNQAANQISPLVSALTLLTCLVTAIVCHEFGHGIVAKWCGATGISITIWALGGVCTSQRQQRPSRELLILAAGPAVNFLFVGLILAADYGLSAWDPAWLTGKTATWVGMWLQAAFLVNLALGIFNLLPIFPLDGGQMAFNVMLLITRRVRLSALVTFVLAVVTAALWLGYLHLHGGLDTWDVLLVVLLLHGAWGLVSTARD